MRCAWCTTDPAYILYHDNEWGVPVHDDRKLFEMLTLEGAQAGLSWLTILKRRENYRTAFDNFNPAAIGLYNKRKIRALLNDAGIIRNRLKIESTVSNAKAFLDVQRGHGSFDAYIWQFAPGTKRPGKKVQATSAESDAMSKDLKKRGFRFVGSTICYAFMQAVGMVNDHAPDCFRNKK
ncbi:MAG: DNA-3-methyladenine glycosylase I [bacterium]